MRHVKVLIIIVQMMMMKEIILDVMSALSSANEWKVCLIGLMCVSQPMTTVCFALFRYSE